MTLQFSWDYEDAKTIVFQNEYPSAVFKFNYWFGAFITTFIGSVNLLIDSKFKVGAAIFLFIGLATFYWLIVGRRLQARGIWRNSQGIIEICEIDKNEIRKCRESSESEQKAVWSDFALFVETNKHFLFYDKKSLTVLIPKRAFANETDLNQFRAWASQINSEAVQTPPLPET